MQRPCEGIRIIGATPVPAGPFAPCRPGLPGADGI
jgi:hypothetical protein